MVTIFGTVADRFDARVEESIEVLDSWVEQSNYSTGSMLTASITQSFMRFSQGFVDVFRLGEGVSEGTASGVGQDALRLLIVAGPLVRLGSAGARLLRARSITQSPNTWNCTWVASVQAVRRSGQAYFLSLKRLFRSAGVSEAESVAITQGLGTNASRWARLQQALTSLRIQGVAHSFHSLQELFQAVRANARSVFIFSIEYGPAGERVSHTLHAALVRGSVRIFDTTGAVYRSIAELAVPYENVVIHSHTALEIPHSVVIQQLASTSGAAATSVNSIEIGLRVIPPAQVRGIQGYGYLADGSRTGDWPEELLPIPTVSGTRGIQGYGCDVNDRPVGRWPSGMTPNCD